MGTLTQVCVRSCPNISAPAGRPFSAGRPAAKSLGGGTGVRVGRGGKGRRPREGNDERVEDLNEPLTRHASSGCSYKEFLACNPKEYDGKRGVVVLTRWIKKMENLCPSHKMQKLESELWNHAMVGAGHVAYTDRFHELARLVLHLISGVLTDEAVRNGSIKKVENRGNMGETSKDKNGMDDNKRTRTGNVFATIVNPVGRENMGEVAISTALGALAIGNVKIAIIGGLKYSSNKG
ncbi:hypothetical protein Tco_0741063 [Tanacetum coccineum]